MSVDAYRGSLTVGAVAELVGISVRTLHHWDQIGLVCPSTRTPAGYRRYQADDIGRLHRVLVYRELGFTLTTIKDLLDDPGVDEEQHLREQRRLLSEQLTALEHMVDAVDRVLARKAAGGTLTAQEQAEIFGRGWREEWGEEARVRWGGSDQWRQFEENVASFTAVERAGLRQAGEALYEEMAAAMHAGTDPSSADGIALAVRHREMISQMFSCTPSMHALLGRMYVEDPRFQHEIDQTGAGLSVWLRDAIYAAARAAGIDPRTATWG